MFVKHTIATPTPASEKMMAFASTTTVHVNIHPGSPRFMNRS
jgi:hypothetical protein